MGKANLFIATVGLASVVSLGCSGGRTSVSDGQITTDIQSKLYSDPVTKQGSVAVAVKDGAVTLTGNVPSSDVELAAMKIANSAAGVKGVSDQIRVSGVSAAAAQVTGAGTPGTPVKAPSGAAPSRLAQSSQPTPLPAPDGTRAELPPPGAVAPSIPSETAPAARPIKPARVTIAAGERLSVRTIDVIDSGRVSEGQALRASLQAPLVSHGQVIVPEGAPVTLTVANMHSAGRIKGNSELSLRATSLEYRGRNYPIATSAFSEEGKGRGKNTAEKTGIGAGVGALIGGLAGGGKGAAIGLGAGGGAGFGLNALTHGQQVKIPSETVLSFRLENPLILPAPR